MNVVATSDGIGSLSDTGTPKGAITTLLPPVHLLHERSESSDSDPLSLTGQNNCASEAQVTTEFSTEYRVDTPIGAVGVSLEWNCPQPEFVPLLCNCCFKMRVKQVECKSRGCGPCGIHRKVRFSNRWKTAMGNFDRGGVFLTLTIPNIYGAIRKNVTRLRNMWKKLWRGSVLRGIRGGWYAIEITRGLSLGWNLHIHILGWGIQGVPLQDLRDEWKRIAGGTWVHVSSVRNAKHAKKYLAKEISKGLRPDDSEAAEEEGVLAALRGLRLLQSFGDLPDADRPDDRPCECGGKWVAFFDETICPPDADIVYDPGG